MEQNVSATLQQQRNRVEARTGYIFIQNGCYVCVALKASSIKGGLISEIFHFGSNLFLKSVKSCPWALSTRNSAQGHELALFF